MRIVIGRAREHVKSIGALLSLEPSTEENIGIPVQWHLYYMQHRLHEVRWHMLDSIDHVIEAHHQQTTYVMN